MIKTESVIGIFDLDNASVSKRTRDFLSGADKKGEVTVVSTDLPKSFIVCADKKNENRIFLSTLSSGTLLKRSGYIG